MKKTFRRGYLVNTAVLIAVYALCVALSVVLADSGSFRLTVVPSIWQCCYLIILAASLNLVLGFMGQLSLGHCGFMAIGAYTAALMSLAFQRAGVYDEKSGAVFILIIFLCIICAGVLAAVFGVLVGIPALRLKGDYLAIITLGFGLIIVNVINNLPFAGQNGLAEGVASSSLYQNGLGFGTTAKVTYLWVALAAVVVCVALMFMFIRSKYGRAVRAIRDDEIAASAAGINTGYYKVLTFAFSAFFAGVAGALYACSNSTLSTVSFSFTNGSILNSTFVVVMVVLGGMGSLTGSIVSAVIMFLLNYQITNGAWLNAMPGFVQGIFAYPMLVYAVVLVIIIMFRPKGIFGTYEFSLLRTPGDIARGFKGSGKKKAKAEGKEVAAQ